MPNRIDWIDIAKGLGIILVVLGHASGASVVGKYIYCFHMPLFFVLSGMCFVPNKYNMAQFVGKRTGQLLLPSIYLTLLFIFISLITVGDFDFNGLKNGLPGALWFLPVLYFAELVYYILFKLSSCKRLISIGLIGIGGGYLATCEIGNFYSIETIPAAIVFYEIGYQLRPQLMRLQVVKNIGFLLLLLLLLPIVRLFICSDILMMCVNAMKWYDYFFATLTVVGFIQLAIKLENCKIKSLLVWLGRNTMMILPIHMAAMNAVGFLRSEVPYVVFKFLEQFFMWGFSICCCLIANRYAPWIIGKKNK